jgi:ribosome biogenesis protein SSF1/2
MKLVEIGPRLTLELFKVERNVFEGEVMYHKYQIKTETEVKQLKERLEKEKLLKVRRRQLQDENVKRKREILEASEKKKKAKFDKSITTHNKEESNEGDDDNDTEYE